jgi:poly(A) polymerase
MPALAGPALGARLRELEALWIASDFSLSREALLRA